VQQAIIEKIETLGEGVIIAHVRPLAKARRRCGVCLKRRPGYDAGPGRRRWRHLDFGTVEVYLEADSPRVKCPDHGVVVAHVPWARHSAGHTRQFDDQAAWLATRSSKVAVTMLMRVAWRTVGAIMTRVWNDINAQVDRFEGVKRIGIDEVSYKKGHRYLMIVVDHDTRCLLWAAPGRDSATVRQFFELLGPERCAQITHVSADGADFIESVVKQMCPNAVQAADPFHIVKWAIEAMDEVRRDIWNVARKLALTEPKLQRGRPSKNSPPRPGHDLVNQLKGLRYCMWKNPENLTDNQQLKLEWIVKNDPQLHRAYMLKEGLRLVFQMPTTADAEEALDRWINRARRSRLPAFVKLQRSIQKHRARILASIEHNLSNALIESTNTKIRLITRKAYGFHTAKPLIAIAMLTLGGYELELPGRK